MKLKQDHLAPRQIGLDEKNHTWSRKGSGRCPEKANFYRKRSETTCMFLGGHSMPPCTCESRLKDLKV